MSEFEIVNPLSDPGWDSRRSEIPGAGIFHGAGWARVLVNTYGYQPEYVIAGGDTVVPLMNVSSSLTGDRGVGLPFTDSCPPLFSAERRPELFNFLNLHAQKQGWKYLEIRDGNGLYPSDEVSALYYGHKLELYPDQQKMLKQFRKNMVRNIRKAEASDLSISLENDYEAMRAFYRLNCVTRRRHGLPPQPWHFFENLFYHVVVPGNATVILASLGKKVISGAVFLQFAGKVYYKYGASLMKYQSLRANNLVMWYAIKMFVKQGYRILDFGRTEVANEGLRRFKLGWGTAETSIQYFRRDVRHGHIIPEKDKINGVHNHIFRHMPMPVLKSIGAVLYRHMA